MFEDVYTYSSPKLAICLDKWLAFLLEQTQSIPALLHNDPTMPLKLL
jgi:hypothetical protein